MIGTEWLMRTPEQARLLNPAFLGLVVWSCARGYKQISDSDLPYCLAFVGLPIVLHKATREALPRTTRTSLPSWLSDHPRALVGYTDRARALVPLIKEGILFGSNGGLLTFEDGSIMASRRPRTMAQFERQASEEVSDCISKAAFVGKWFAGSGSYTTVMALWGVRP